MWFCHNHGDNGTQKSQGRILPKSKECFVGDTYLLVDKGNINVGVVKLTSGGNVVCRRCGNLMGLATETQNGKLYYDQFIEYEDGIVYFIFLLIFSQRIID